MIIKSLWIQRKCDYPDQYAPELIAAIDEYGNDDNPDYIDDEYKKALQEQLNGEYVSITIIDIHVPEIDINKALSIPLVVGKINT